MSRAAGALRAAVLVAAVIVLAGAPARAGGDIRVEGGWMRDARASADPATPKDAFYYRVDYQGTSLADYGKAFGALPDPNASMARLLSEASDSTDLSVHFERGAVTASGDVFNASGIRPIGITLPALRRLRGTARANGSLDGSSTTFALGIETPPFHAPAAFGLTRASIAHWLVVGLQAEHRQRDEVSTDFSDGSALGARFFLGRGLGPRGHSARQRQELAVAMAAVRARVRNYREAEAVDKAWRAAHKGEARPAMEGAIGGIVGGLEDQVDDLPAAERARVIEDANWWAEQVATWASDQTLPADQPRAAVWLDGYVRREFGAGRISDAALQLLRAQLQVWLSIANPDEGWLTVAYVNGFDQAMPGVRREQLLVSFGVGF